MPTMTIREPPTPGGHIVVSQSKPFSSSCRHGVVSDASATAIHTPTATQTRALQWRGGRMAA